MTEKIKLLIVDDEDPFRELLVDRFARHEFLVTGCGSAAEALEAIGQKEFDVGVIDIKMPGMDGIELFRKIRESAPYFEAIILTGQATIDSAIEAMKLGAYDYLPKPCKLFELELIIRKAYEKKMLAMENLMLRNRLTMGKREYAITGESEQAGELRKLVERLSQSDTPLLVCGEGGTGKEHVARAIHHLSHPDEAPFIAVTCGVDPHGILENQLFGYEKDAFTGAVSSKVGWLEMADGGTLYLEDVEELHPSTQVKIHRFIEAGNFQRIGGNTDITSRVRIIASSRYDLRDFVMKQNFREDLYYRLSVITINVPTLRERKADIPLLIEDFLRRHTGSNGKTFSKKAINAILKYDWPGNVRELLNVVERAILLTPKKIIQAKDIPLSLDKRSKSSKLRHLMSLSEVEKEHILYVLSASGGNISKAARILGISRPKLYRKLEQYKEGKREE